MALREEFYLDGNIAAYLEEMLEEGRILRLLGGAPYHQQYCPWIDEGVSVKDKGESALEAE